MSRDRQRVEAPLLKAYLREAPSWPTSMPVWIVPAGVAVGCLVLLLSEWIGLFRGIQWLVAGGIGWVTVHTLRNSFQPRDEAGRAVAMRYEAIRKLQHLNQQGIQKRLPPEVVQALEEAVAARNTALARVHTEEPLAAATATAAIDGSLHACLVAAANLARDDNTSGREWTVVLNNTTLIGEVVDAIQGQTLRMRNGAWGGHERLAALRELNELSVDDSLRLHD